MFSYIKLFSQFNITQYMSFLAPDI